MTKAFILSICATSQMKLTILIRRSLTLRTWLRDIWSGPLGPDKDHAADLTGGRVRWSSNCCGLR